MAKELDSKAAEAAEAADERAKKAAEDQADARSKADAENAALTFGYTKGPADIKLYLGFRFGVYFFTPANKKGESLDIRFQKVSGLSASIKTRPQPEGGQNLYTQQLPDGIEYGRLVLERGMMKESTLRKTLDQSLRQYRFTTTNVMVILLDDEAKPAASWLFLKAFPVKWSLSNFDASQKSLVIETIELAYTQMQILNN